MKRIIYGVLLAAATLSTLSDIAWAQSDDSYWISMPSYASGRGEAFVPAAVTSTGAQAIALQACDGNTYYLAQGDFDTVQAALTGNTVQLNVGAQGSDPAQSSSLCMLQIAS